MQAGNKSLANIAHQNLNIGDDNIEQVKEFMYLGTQVNSTNDINAEII